MGCFVLRGSYRGASRQPNLIPGFHTRIKLKELTNSGTVLWMTSHAAPVSPKLLIVNDSLNKRIGLGLEGGDAFFDDEAVYVYVEGLA